MGVRCCPPYFQGGRRRKLQGVTTPLQELLSALAPLAGRGSRGEGPVFYAPQRLCGELLFLKPHQTARLESSLVRGKR